MAIAQISWVAAKFSLHQVLLPKLCYPLIATTFTEVQCHNLLKLVLWQGLPVIRLNQNFPCTVAQGPLTYQGLNLPNLFTEQLISHVHTLMKFGSHANDTMGKHQIVTPWNRHCQASLSNINRYFQPCVTPTWFSHCWSQFVQQGIETSIEILEVVPKCLHNKELMTIYAQKGFWEVDLALLNRCCMYLHVILFLDVCNGTRMGIKWQYWAGSTVLAKIYPFQWPTMVKPTPGECAFWQHSLQLSFDLSRQQQLPLPLGCWQSNVIKDK